MKLYKVTTTLAPDWDCADAFVVRAASVDDAKELTMGFWGDIRPTMDEMEVERLGEAFDQTPQGQIVLRSFRAG